MYAARIDAARAGGLLKGLLRLKKAFPKAQEYNARVALPSISADDWNQRVALNNYRCRSCHEYIPFDDQKLYFANGLCTPCLHALVEDPKPSDSDSRKGTVEIRSRKDH